MTRIACLMMLKDEELLLRPWLVYHGYLFGFENLYVYDNGSSSEIVRNILKEFSAIGVNVDDTKTEPSDFQNKGVLLGEKIGEFKVSESYDIALLLDCDEFLALGSDGDFSCNRTKILAELDRINIGGTAARTSYCLDNRPGFVDLFRYVNHVKSIVVVREFRGIDHGFHQATLGAGQQYQSTDIIHIHFHFKPFGLVLESARNKLAPYVNTADKDALKTFSGVGNHLIQYFFMSPAEYYRDMRGYRLPLVRFGGLIRVLNAAFDLRAFAKNWENGRPEGILDGTIEIDLDKTPFSSERYLGANPDLRRSGVNAFAHFLNAGYQEGRKLDASDVAFAEVVERMEYLRARRRDGIAGYVGSALPLSRLGRGEEADGILRRAVKDFGTTAALLREYALLAMYDSHPKEAAVRWEVFRSAFPERSDGYQYGIISYLQAGSINAAEETAEVGLRRFPGHVGVLMASAELAVAKYDWARAKASYEEILQKEPNNRAAKEKMGDLAFKLRLAQIEQLTSTDIDVMNGPVVVDMTDGEVEETLSYLGFRAASELRDFFMTFESLGYSCEFGLVQRRFGAEPMGLLRWNSIHLPQLISALEDRFEGMQDKENLVLIKVGEEYVLRDLKYLTAMHTFKYAGEVEYDNFMVQMTRRVEFLRRKLISDLEAAEKIFVYLDMSDAPGNLERLARAIRSYGHSTILYVRVAQKHSQVGTVEVMGPGVLIGFIERQGRRSDGTWDIAFDSWLSVCKSANVYFRAIG